MITPVRTLKVGILCERKEDLLVSVDDIKMIARSERNKAIEEFAERLHELCGMEIGDYQYPDLLHESRIDEIAVQLKGE